MSQITVNPDQTTLWLSIRVRSEDDKQAVLIANAVANSLIKMSPSGADSGANPVKSSINNQIEQVEQEVTDTEAMIRGFQDDLKVAKDQSSQRLIETRIAEQQSYLTRLRTTLTSLYPQYLQTYTNQLTLVESPKTAVAVDSQVKIFVMLAGLAALIATLAIILAFEYFGSQVTIPKISAPEIDKSLLGGLSQHLSGENSAAQKHAPQEWAGQDFSGRGRA